MNITEYIQERRDHLRWQKSTFGFSFDTDAAQDELEALEKWYRSNTMWIFVSAMEGNVLTPEPIEAEHVPACGENFHLVVNNKPLDLIVMKRAWFTSTDQNDKQRMHRVEIRGYLLEHKNQFFAAITEGTPVKNNDGEHGVAVRKNEETGIVLINFGKPPLRWEKWHTLRVKARA